jgi:transcription antitermination factor NusB
MIDERSLVRGVVLQALYELDSTDHNEDDVLKFYAGTPTETEHVRVVGYLTLRARLEQEEKPPALPTVFLLPLNRPVEERTAVEQLLIGGITEGVLEAEITDDMIAEIIHLDVMPDTEDFDLRLTTPAQLLPLHHQKQVHRLVHDIHRVRHRLDDIIRRYAPEYPIDQLAAVDRNILRIAIYEFAVSMETPVRVAISEAVELAKIFGSDTSYRFVNGVLGSVAIHLDQIASDIQQKTEEV